MPSNLTTTGINLAFVASCVFSLMALAQGIAALLSDHWFDYSASTANSYSLWRGCSGAVCGEILFTDINQGICTLSGSEVQGRFVSLRGLLIAGATLCLVHVALVAAAACCNSLSTYMAGIVCSVMALFCFATTVGLFYNTVSSFLFCGMNACDYYRTLNTTAKCYYMYGGPFALVWTAAAASTIAAVMGAAALHRMRAPERLRKMGLLAAPTTRPTVVVAGTAGAAGREMSALRQTSPRALSPRAGGGGAGAAPQQQLPPLAEWRMTATDFEFDDASALFYSDDAQLFWHRESNHFFDPSCQMWFDPEGGVWAA